MIEAGIVLLKGNVELNERSQRAISVLEPSRDPNNIAESNTHSTIINPIEDTSNVTIPTESAAEMVLTPVEEDSDEQTSQVIQNIGNACFSSNVTLISNEGCNSPIHSSAITEKNNCERIEPKYEFG